MALHFLPSRNWWCQLRGSYVIYILWVKQKPRLTSYKMVSARKWLYVNPSDSICTRNKGTEPRVPVWHSGTCEAFFIHVGSAREAIEKKGSFKSTVYKESSKSYACRAKIKKLGYSGTFSGKRNKIKQLQSQLAEKPGTSGQTGTSRKSNKIPMRLWLKPVQRAQPCVPT